ncbi:YDG domain-containing protein [Anaeroarcus burkinensis]|uniref:two-partner secretion domain-containing protein n=1 Tax=Anaeroarcus burkinensis TaxID=82376 RepID=UPI0003FAF32A|nr:YDG domain-containing protein [Anaeroarcus burkinensis]
MQRKWKRNGRQLALALAAAMLLHNTLVLANPTDGQVVAGKAAIASNGATMTITQQTDKAAINWRSFSIASGEKVQILQPGASSVLLNRVVGNNASSIYGTLSANGQVFLINPNGVLFAPGSQVNVGGLVASTRDLTNANFLAGKYAFSGDSSAAVVNEGTLTAADGGYVALLGAQAKNNGIIVAKQGTVALGAGQAVTLDLAGDGFLNLAVDQAALQASVANAGTITADGGRVYLSAKAADTLAGTVVNNSGRIQAQRLRSENGVIILDGATNGTTTNSGTLDASSAAADVSGGTLKVLGNKVSLTSTAALNASGDAGGGTILVGGNYQGSGTETQAASTSVAAGATLNADALTNGDGGKVVVWAKGDTSFAGSITARGGSQSGNGGLVETSGKETLLFKGKVNTLAPKGKAGKLLLDPADFTIEDDHTAVQANVPGNSSGSSIDAPGEPSVSGMAASDLLDLLRNGDVTIQTTSPAVSCLGVDPTFTNIYNRSGGTGKITVAAPLDWSSSAGSNALTHSSNASIYSLTLLAANGIEIGAPINSGGSLTLKTAGGDVAIKASISAAGSLISAPAEGFNTTLSNGATLSGNKVTVYSKTAPTGLSSYTYGSVNDPNSSNYSGWVLNQLLLSLSAVDKVYDGTTAATVNPTAGLENGDSVTITGTFANANAANGKTVTAALTSNPNNKYKLSATPLTANITAKPLSLSDFGLSSLDKTYDGQGNNNYIYNFPGNGRTIVLSTTYGGKNVGAQTVSATLNDSLNFSLPSSLPATATITAKPLTVGNITFTDKIYNGTNATPDFAFTSADKISGDTLTVHGSFADKNVGTAKAISSWTLDGADAGNYVLQTLSGSYTGNITAKPLTVSGVTVGDKVYDGKTTATISGFSSNKFAGDQLTLNGSFDTKDVGNNKSLTNLALSGNDSQNYVLSTTTIGTGASITAAPLYYTAAPISIPQNRALPPLSGSITGTYYGTDNFTSVFGSNAAATWTTTATASSPAGTYSITGSGLQPETPNYALQQATSNNTALTIIGSSLPPGPPTPPTPPGPFIPTLPSSPSSSSDIPQTTAAGYVFSAGAQGITPSYSPNHSGGVSRFYDEARGTYISTGTLLSGPTSLATLAPTTSNSGSPILTTAIPGLLNTLNGGIRPLFGGAGGLLSEGVGAGFVPVPASNGAGALAPQRAVGSAPSTATNVPAQEQIRALEKEIQTMQNELNSSSLSREKYLDLLLQLLQLTYKLNELRLSASTSSPSRLS